MQTRPLAGGPVDRSLTAREELLFRAVTRRRLRSATVLSGTVVAVAEALYTPGMAVLFPQHGVALLVINGLAGGIALGVAVLALRRWRLPPLPLAFVLVVTSTLVVACLVVFAPDLRTMSLMLLVLLPPAIPLFLPFSVRVDAAWLLAAGAGVAVLTVSPAGAVVPGEDWVAAWLVFVTAGIVSLVGSVSASMGRRTAFVHRMEARRAHLRTVAREAELERLSGQLARMTRTDPLTGIGNRLRLDEELTMAAARATRYGTGCAIVMLDLDGFKGYNDALGHIVGDGALRAVATALSASVRAADTVCRFGGDEFVVLMPEQSLEAAEQAVERIQRAIEDLGLQFPTPRDAQVLTISAGVALLGHGASHDEDEVLRLADAALYRAKGAGCSQDAAAPRAGGLPIAAD